MVIQLVGSSRPAAVEGSKGLAVRQLKRYVSWVQTAVRQVGSSLCLVTRRTCMKALEYERTPKARTSGVPVVIYIAPLGS